MFKMRKLSEPTLVCFLPFLGLWLPREQRIEYVKRQFESPPVVNDSLAYEHWKW